MPVHKMANNDLNDLKLFISSGRDLLRDAEGDISHAQSIVHTLSMETGANYDSQEELLRSSVEQIHEIYLRLETLSELKSL